MRALLASIALSTLLAVPASAQAPKFITVDIVGKSVNLSHCNEKDGPTEVHVRVPISLAKGLLDMSGESEVKINGKNSKPMKVDQIIKLLESAKPGDLLLEVTTDKGDLVKITVQ
jgi:hypothetical protein